jgi:hypothetical protein
LHAEYAVFPDVEPTTMAPPDIDAGEDFAGVAVTASVDVISQDNPGKAISDDVVNVDGVVYELSTRNGSDGESAHWSRER